MRSFRNLAFISLFIILTSGTLYAKTDAPGIPLEANPRGIAMNAQSDIAISVNEKSDSVSVTDMNTQKVVATIPVGGAPKDIAANGAFAVVTNSHDDTASIIDMTSYEVIATIAVGTGPEGVAITAHQAFVTNRKDGTISVIDLTALSVIKTISAGQEPVDIAIDPELGIALVVNQKDYNVSVIDMTAFDVTGTIPVGKRPIAISINPETHTAVVVNEKDNSITIINLLDLTTRTISVGKHPVGVAVNTLDNRALVICDEDRSLILIDLSTGTIVKNYALNKLPRGVAVNNFTNIAGVVDDKTDSLTLIGLPNPVPVIDSITPNTLLRGSKGQTIILEGSKFIKTSQVSISSGNASYDLTITFIDNRLIEALLTDSILESTGTWRVTITNPAPEGGTSSHLMLNIENPVPQIALFEPMEAIAGTVSLDLDVHGLGFFGDTGFAINGESRAANYESYRKAHLVLSSSDLEYGRYLDITATNPSPGGGTSNAGRFTVLNPVPSLAGINPVEIVAKSNNFTLTLSGGGFVKTSTVKYDSVTLPTAYVSNSVLQAEVSSSMIQTPGDFPVTVSNPEPGGGMSVSVTLKVKDPKPEITGIEVVPDPPVCQRICPPPTCRDRNCPPPVCYDYCPPPTPGTLIAGRTLNLKITGRNFTPDTYLLVNETIVGASLINSSSMTFSFLFPYGAAYTIIAKTPLAQSDPVALTVPNPVPSLSSISPSSIAAGSGAVAITATGSNIVQTSKVYLNGIELQTTYVSSTSLTAVVSEAIVAQDGDYAVSISNPLPGGGLSVSQTFSVKKPYISQIDPQSIYIGNASGMPYIQIYGGNFVSGTVVTLSGVELPVIYSMGSSYIFASIPQEAVSQVGNLSLAVTNPGGSSGTTAFMVLENPVPAIAGLYPSELTVSSPQNSVRVYGNFVRNAQVFLDGQPVSVSNGYFGQDGSGFDVAIPGSFFDSTGYHTISVVNPPPGGGVAEATFGIVNPTPSFSQIWPSTINLSDLKYETTTVYLQAYGIVKDSAMSVNGTSVYPLTNLGYYWAPDLYSANIQTSIFKAPGEYQIVVSNPAPGGGSSASRTLVVDGFSIETTYPQYGASSAKSTTLIKGIMESYGPIATIKVAGIMAETFFKNNTVRGGMNVAVYEWAINDVALQPGVNDIVIEASDSEGRTTTQTTRVNFSESHGIALHASVNGGLSPLKIHFSIDYELPSAIREFRIDFEGDGVIDYSGTGFEDISYVYTNGGLYYPKATVIDSQGHAYSDIIAVMVHTREGIDTKLKKVWEGMKAALISEDIEEALVYYTEASQEKYREIFEVLSLRLHGLASSMGEITLIDVKGNVAEYYIKRSQKNTEISYFIYFIKDADGIWRIRAF